jgi:phosphoglycerol transferase
VVVAVIAAVCLIAWCSANAKWTAHAWAIPSTYVHDPERADFVSNAAYLKASSHWSGMPFRWKTVPELGAPNDGNWNDFPLLDEIVLTIQVMLSRLLGLFFGMNASFALAHMLACTALFIAARLSGVTCAWSAIAGLAFGVSPFIFNQSPHHMQVAYVWPVAFFPLVWRATVTAPGLAWGSRRFWWSVAFSFVAGLHFVYYTNVFCQIVLLGAAIQWFHTRDAAPLKAALAVIVAAAAGFAINNVDEWTYRLFHEPNFGAFVREYKWLEIYGLKLVDLVIPPVTHRSDMIARFAAEHHKAAPLLDENASYLGIVGLLALGWLLWTAIRAGVRGRFDEIPIEAWWILWIVLMFTTGGLNAIIGALGFTMFRGGCRYSIVILAITLLWAARRLSAIQADRKADGADAALDWRSLAAAAVVSLVILWDQVPRAPTAEETATIARLVQSDREFTGKMEAALPDGAMVFQMPVMEYPESPIPGVPPYDHFRPYLYSKNLRYSFGSQKGREREKWQPAVQGKFFEGAALDQQAGVIRVDQANARAAVDELKRLGFSAIYINRNGFPDRGRGIEEALLELGYATPPIRNASGDLACIVLAK